MKRRIAYYLAAGALLVGAAVGAASGNGGTANGDAYGRSGADGLAIRQKTQQIVKDGFERAAIVDRDPDGYADSAAAPPAIPASIVAMVIGQIDVAG